MKKVTSIVLNNFTNDSRVLKENISLQNAGYEVKVVALWEEGLEEFESIGSMEVHRVKLRSKTWSKNGLVQIFKYFEFLYRVVKEYKKSDILHCNDLNALPAGVLIKKFFNKKMKIVYDAHEYETEIDGLRGMQKTLIKMLERLLIKYADKVICVSDAIADEYVRLYNIPKPNLVLNTPSYREIDKKDIFREKLKIDKDKVIFLYQGGLSSGRGIEILLDTFKKIKNQDVVIVFMGYGTLEDTIKKEAKENKAIYFHEAVSPDILLDYTSSADFGISTIEDSCLSYRYCLPNKMFEYLMADIPVVVSNLPEMKKIILDYRVGVVAVKNTPQGLDEAIKQAVELNREELQKNIQKVKEIYNWEEQEKVLVGIYGKLCDE